MNVDIDNIKVFGLKETILLSWVLWGQQMNAELDDKNYLVNGFWWVRMSPQIAEESLGIDLDDYHKAIFVLNELNTIAVIRYPQEIFVTADHNAILTVRNLWGQNGEPKPWSLEYSHVLNDIEGAFEFIPTRKQIMEEFKKK